MKKHLDIVKKGKTKSTPPVEVESKPTATIVKAEIKPQAAPAERPKKSAEVSQTSPAILVLLVIIIALLVGFGTYMYFAR